MVWIRVDMLAILKVGMKASDTVAYLDIQLAEEKAALKEAIADASLAARKAVCWDALLV